MSQLQYVRIIGQAPKICFAAFTETKDPHHAMQLLASIGDIRRLKPEWQSEIASDCEIAERLIRDVNPLVLQQTATDLNFSTLTASIELLESVRLTDIEHADRRLFAVCTFDDWFDIRDQVHLAFKEFERRGISISPDKYASLAQLDERCQSNEIIRWAMLVPRPHLSIYTPADLRGLWWWQQGTHSPTSQIVSIFKKPSPFLSRLQHWLWPTNVGFVARLAPLSAALVVIVGVSLLWLSMQNGVLVSLHDGSRTVTMDKKGTVSGFESPLPAEDTRTIVTALSDPSKLGVPIEQLKKIKQPVAGPISMGGDSATFRLIMPIGLVLEDQQPTFTWNPLNGAADYTVVIFQYGGSEFARGRPVVSAEWRIAADQVQSGQGRLERGGTYIWQVDAQKAGTTVTADRGVNEAALFTVVSDRDFNRLQQARDLDSPLLLGIRYLEVGMLKEAEKQFESLAEANPTNLAADRLLKFTQKSIAEIAP